MSINDILENEELKKLLNDSIGKTYYRYKLFSIIEYEDFIQEAYLHVMKKIEKFDNEKSSLYTFIPMLVMCCAKCIIQSANGQSTKHNKLELKNNTLSLDYEIETKDDSVKFIDGLIVDNIDNTDNKMLIGEILSMKTLSDRERTVLILMYKGYSQHEIGRMFNKSHTLINIAFKKAKKKILNKYAV